MGTIQISRIQHKQKPILAIARTEPITKRGCGLKLGQCMQKCRARNSSWYFIAYGTIFILISDPSLLRKTPDTFYCQILSVLFFSCRLQKLNVKINCIKYASSSFFEKLRLFR